MWVRPTFRLEGEKLIREPAGDFTDFVHVQRAVIENELGGLRSRRRVGSFLAYELRQFGFWPFGKSAVGVGGIKVEPIDVDAMISLNLRILEELGNEVQSAGGRFIVVDLSGYFAAAETLPSELAMRCIQHNFGYLPLGRWLVEARRKGTKLNWQYDGHFNEAGNEVFATVLYDWLRQNESRSNGP
jgi:hypothetical protein